MISDEKGSEISKAIEDFSRELCEREGVTTDQGVRLMMAATLMVALAHGRIDTLVEAVEMLLPKMHDVLAAKPVQH